MTARHQVFLSYHRADAVAVTEVAERLRREGLEPWLDAWNLVPGEPWQPAIEQALDEAAVCVVFVGPGGIGPWQHEEMRVAIDRRVTRRGFRVIPVLLPGAERGRRSAVPPFLANVTWVEFPRTLDDAPSLHRLVSGIRGVRPGPGPGGPAVEGICPYRGLQAFDVADQPFFFGRAALTEWLVSDLGPKPGGRPSRRFLGIVGASGSGKSSLARAGLLAALQQGALPGSEAWPQVIFRPGADPLESLALAAAGTLGLTQDRRGVVGFIEDLGREPRTLHLQVSLALRDAPVRRVVILVDQFEEVFTLCCDAARRRAFVDALLYAGTVASGATVVVLALRADFVGHCTGIGELAASLSDNQELVGPMTDDELRDAIEQPALRSGVAFEEGLVETLLADVKAQPGGLPLLQHALFELWQTPRSGRLTHEAYAAIGRVEGALAGRAGAVYDGMAPADRAIARRVLLRLTQPGEGTEDIRRRATLEELIPSSAERPAVEAVVTALADARLVVTEGDEAERTVDMAHEALVRGWPPLRQWIAEDRAGLLEHRRLTTAAKEWKRLGEDPSALLRGLRLDQALEWRGRYEAGLNDVERAFLDASVRLRENEGAQARRRARRNRVSASVVALVFGVALGALTGGPIKRWVAGRLLARELKWERIPPPPDGEFQMGCVPHDRECDSDESRHWVKLARAFDLMKHEVTRGQFRRFTTTDGRVRFPRQLDVPPDDRPDDHPVIAVDWYDARRFCEFVGGRLPTEAEWEYAARRAHPDSIYPWGNDFSRGQANSKGLGGADRWERTAPVGSFQAYGGLHDMAGNVWEWTSTLVKDYPYDAGDGRENPNLDELRRARGGSWAVTPELLRVSSRAGNMPHFRFVDFGLRCAKDVPP